MAWVNYFTKDNGVKLPVDRSRYLFSALSPTSEGTRYWESPPPSPLTDRQIGRIVLQVHQMLSLFRGLGIDLQQKTLLDIGTGNGMVPQLILYLTNLASALGTDPFLDGEHKTSWQVHDHDKGLARIKTFIQERCGNILDYKDYQQIASLEHTTFIPQALPIATGTDKPYNFSQLGVHDLDTLNETYDIIYCKAIEHIHNWDKAFSNITKISKSGSFFYIKHRSFFSYLGAHRYASTDIPWGHVLLNDSEFDRYAKEVHPERATQMSEFFFEGLTYPRGSITDLLRIAQKYGFALEGIQIEAPRYQKTIFTFSSEIEGFWDIVRENYPQLGYAELNSGIIHIILRKH